MDPTRIPIFDRLLAETLDAGFKKTLEQYTAHIDVTDAIRYLTEVDEKENISIGDFPTVLPPFQHMWLESQMPEKYNVGGKVTKLHNAGLNMRYACAFDTIEQPDGYEIISTMFIPKVGMGRDFVLAAISHLDKHGKGNDKELVKYISPNHDYIQEVERRGLQADLWWQYLPFFFAISLMHCKNVRLVDLPRNEKLSKARRRRGNPPLVRFRTLQIEPMKKVLSTAASEHGGDLKLALHICRGHFKDYRESGLFGKYKGIFWWDAMVRGDIKEGVVAKTYEVKAPKK